MVRIDSISYIKDLEAEIELVVRKKKRLTKPSTSPLEIRTLGDMAKIMLENFPDLELSYEEKDKLMPDRGTLSVKAKSSWL